MKSPEARALAKKAGELFGELKPEVLKLVLERILPFDKTSVATAMKNHRVNHDFFSFPQFMEGCHAEFKRSQARLKKYRQESVGSWLMTGKPFTQATAGAAITEHYSNCWQKVLADPDADDYGMQTIRKMILGHATNAFREIGWPEQDCIEHARACVELEPGQKIMVPKLSGGNLVDEESEGNDLLDAP